MRAEEIKIDTDEDGFYLVLRTDAGHLRVNVQDCATQLLAECEREIGPWAKEAASFRQRRSGRACWPLRPLATYASTMRHWLPPKAGARRRLVSHRPWQQPWSRPHTTRILESSRTRLNQHWSTTWE